MINLANVDPIHYCPDCRRRRTEQRFGGYGDYISDAVTAAQIRETMRFLLLDQDLVDQARWMSTEFGKVADYLHQNLPIGQPLLTALLALVQARSLALEARP